MYPPHTPPTPPTFRYENLLPQISGINQRAIVKYHPEHHCINYSAIFRLLSLQFTLSRGHVTGFSGRHFPSVYLFEETSSRAVFQFSAD